MWRSGRPAVSGLFTGHGCSPSNTDRVANPDADAHPDTNAHANSHGLHQ
ncbi:hypothetical protein OUO20_03860 [Arthrobacter sp. FX8]|jgi:hypothetical protein|nr:hypothetical protein [Arthrobacter sp. FX8]WAJ34128.1 hypothetical protein OUO20_03860 [Arthrobacter sp. FX8]